MTDLVGSSSRPFGLWGRAFRPFFLAGAAHAALVVPWWALIWLGALNPPAWLNPIAWHGHEMIFGFVAAAIAGFILTASPVWSGGPALTGRPLAGLVALWMAGRVSIALAGLVPTWLAAGLDALFLPTVALAMLRTLWGSGQLRNYGLVGILAVLSAANWTMHADALGLAPGAAAGALRFAVDGVIVLVLVIGGRITPAFTRNAFALRGIERPIRARPWLDALTIGAAATLAVAGLLLDRGIVTGVVASVAGLAAAARLAGWQPLATRSDPLLWSLHAGAAWAAAGLLLVGASDLGVGIPLSAGLHALTAGALGTTILAVMTRVGVGHTGRPLAPPPQVVWCYVLVSAAALLRVGAPFLAAPAQRAVLLTSALAWSAAFALFALRYAPLLTTPRPDGQPG